MDLSLIDLILESFGRGECLAAAAFNFGDFILEAGDSSEAVLFLGGEFSENSLRC
jgi:hypothetical protein